MKIYEIIGWHVNDGLINMNCSDECYKVLFENFTYIMSLYASIKEDSNFSNLIEIDFSMNPALWSDSHPKPKRVASSDLFLFIRT